ncbi:sulfotransferase domain-containing protein [candidate division KSB1 bacterium]|nr:sulfotransferase domain-containing protein [candidate division KSB1 bacterium]NIR68796.1 sulfotransferase domain-containing protein [candidate division KSB1 bacterium]NIS28128.1 sulfotransferase domain-containing protein [candidate division KSB1 bacterium]NIT75024.1 sulfotransferase domain-containing protein [candidate division KSB1 bacterium]NIU28808.1 sulfotransferase domain-containing protein [candidate division KSB1 bacterium]
MKVLDFRNTEVLLPDFLIVGAPKSGTTSLYHYLKQHPEICLPEVKEPCFFSSYGIPESIFLKNIFPMAKEKLVTEYDEYLSLFSSFNKTGKRIIGEASTHYLFQYEETISNLKFFYKSQLSNLKIIIVLRNPIEAAYSNYQMWAMKGLEVADFEMALHEDQTRYHNQNYNIAYLHKYSYYEQVKTYLDNFENVKIYLYEELQSEPEQLVKKIFNYLGVDGSFVPDDIGIKYNISGKLRVKSLHKFLYEENTLKTFLIPVAKKIGTQKFRDRIRKKVTDANVKRVSMKSSTRQFLKKTFSSNILKTGDLIGQDLSTWLEY